MKREEEPLNRKHLFVDKYVIVTATHTQVD